MASPWCSRFPSAALEYWNQARKDSRLTTPVSSGKKNTDFYVVANPAGMPLGCTKAGTEAEAWQRFTAVYALDPAQADKEGYCLVEFA